MACSVNIEHTKIEVSVFDQQPEAKPQARVSTWKNFTNPSNLGISAPELSDFETELSWVSKLGIV